jgi:tetratricopeptide (TPR) repeat protein
VTGQPQTRPALAALLWGDMSETAARTNLRKALANLRQVLGDYLDTDRLFDYLREKNMLLVLDNLEHLLASSSEGEIGGAELISEILAVVPRVKILVTSREALNLQEAGFHPVAGMSFPPPRLPSAPESGSGNIGSNLSLEKYDAVQLFVQCASLALLDHPLLANQDTRLEKAAILFRLGRLALNSDWEEARRLFEQSLHLYRAVGDPWWTAQMLGWLGEVDWEAGRYGQAQARLQLGLDLAQACDDQAGIGYALLWLGRLTLSRNLYSQAWQLQHDSARVFRMLGQRDQLSTALASLGLVHYKLGDWAEARQYLAEALQTAVEIGAFLPLLVGLPLASLLLAEQGEPELFRFRSVINSISYKPARKQSLTQLDNL